MRRPCVPASGTVAAVWDVAFWVGLWLVLLVGAGAVWFVLVRRLWRQWTALFREFKSAVDLLDRTDRVDSA